MDIGGVVIFFEEIVDCGDEVFVEGCEMCVIYGGVLVVDEGVIFFVVVVVVGYCDFDVFVFDVDKWI